MSELKLYAVKNDKGKYWDFGSDNGDFWTVCDNLRPTATCEKEAKQVSASFGGHVVALIEEPKKVVLTKEQAKVIKETHDAAWPAKYITDHCDNSNGLEELLMNAYVNGYTVEKEKKYRVITPKSWWESENEPEYMHMNVLNGIENYKGADDDTLFTQKQLDLYELNGAPFTKEEVTDDGTK